MADVTRPLFSVGQTTDEGNLVIFGSKGGMILNIESETATTFRRVNRNYEIDFWVNDNQSQDPFRGPGM